MGALNSRYLTKKEQNLEHEGRLNATIGDIWEPKAESYAGSYDRALLLRRYQKPEMYERLLDYCSQHKSASETGQLMEEWLTQTTATVVTNVEDDTEEQVIEVEAKDKAKTKSFVEPFSHAENEVHKVLISILGGTNKSRAHLLPEDKECRKFWGKIAELVSGAEIDVNDHGFRKVLVDIIKDFRVNLMVFDGNHAEFFDNLKTGVLLAVPLLKPEKLAEWKHKVPYEVLIACDSPEAYKLFARTTDFEHVQWATTDDIDLATTVLAETSKVLADSLDTHWDQYYSLQGNTDEFRLQQLSYLKGLLRKEHKVLVPGIKDPSGYKLHFGLTGQVKLIKVNLGMVYKGDFAAYIPDPWIVSFKAASNWSAFAYPLYRNKRLKLAPACSCDDSESGTHPAAISLSSSHAKAFWEDAKRRQDKEIVGTEFCGTSLQTSIPDDDSASSVSTLGDESIAGARLVSDE